MKNTHKKILVRIIPTVFILLVSGVPTFSQLNQKLYDVDNFSEFKSSKGYDLDNVGSDFTNGKPKKRFGRKGRVTLYGDNLEEDSYSRYEPNYQRDNESNRLKLSIPF